MKLTCTQMDVLISFYIDGDLSTALKKQVENHLQNCPSCRAKYDIIKSMLVDLKNCLSNEEEKSNLAKQPATSQQYRLFKNDLSAYIDNELSEDESIKIKKFTINNKNARKELEDNYNIRKLMNESFKKSESEIKKDFSKSILKQLELEDEIHSNIHPAVKLIIAFAIAVLVLTSIVLTSLSI